MLLAVAQVPPSVQGGVGDQQQAPGAPHASPCLGPARPGPPLPAPWWVVGAGLLPCPGPCPGPAMLDFAIFAVTFLLVLVGAVLYLYPVMAAGARHGPGAGSGRPRGPARPLPSARDVAAGPGRACTLLGVSALRHPACNQPP